MRAAAMMFALGLAIAAPALPAQESAETKLRSERERLDRIRRERAQLEVEMRRLRGTVHDLSAEVRNLDRQADATARLVQSLDTELANIGREVDQATTDLTTTEQQLVDSKETLQRRLIAIYKRGPLHTYEALLTSSSFGQLVARYKYLRLLTDRDRDMVSRVQQLRDQVRRQRTNLVRFQQAIELTRQEKADEERRLRDLEGRRQRSLTDTRRRAQQTDARLKRIARDEARLTSVIASLEAARRRAERAAPNAPRAPSTLRTSDLGRLDWPVEGTIIYNFGRVVNPNNTTTRWNGIGIATETGTPVKSVAAGKVVVAESFGTYGLTIIVQHGGGDYSVYGSLSRLAVAKDGAVSKGQVIGHVGSADPELGPHLHFEIRPQGRAMDPLEWLRGRR
ncbi:MAG: peptidoglycan DD-metalloendopeptidase family protein [Gemmatimonadota bacterium]|nr:peptidoglycan DD-metalloendopeptidase family protein [Gemmatimonadota bacterium]